MGAITLNINPKDNQPPNSSGWLSLPLDYNELYVFSLADFTTNTNPPYGDPEGDTFESIIVKSLPLQGVLSNNGSAVLVDQDISAMALSGGLLSYQSDASDTDGYSDSSMTFLVSDEGSNSYSYVPYAVTFNVSYDESSENNGPTTVGDAEVYLTIGDSFTFTRNSLTNQLEPPYLDPEGDIAENLLIEEVPVYGEIKLNGVLVVNNQIVSFTDIDSGLLIYTNNSEPISGDIEGFKFKISDVGSGEYTG